MLNPESNHRSGILYVDDEEKALKYFRLAFGQKFQITTALSGEEGLEILKAKDNRIEIVISDQRMPGMKGFEFLEVVRHRYPQIIRMLTTAYSDLDDAIKAVNRGHIYQYVIKPWGVPELELELRRAAEYHKVLRERDELLKLKMSTLQRILCGDRVKWLLLAVKPWAKNDQLAFRRALRALISQLPDNLNPAAAKRSRGVSARDYDIGVLLEGEYANAVRCLDGINAADTSAGEAINQLGLAMNEALESAEVSVNDGADGGGFALEITGKGASQAEVEGLLGGVLSERESGDVGIQTLAALSALAKEGKALTINGDMNGKKFGLKFAFDETLECSEIDVIDALSQQFARADISMLPEKQI